MKNNVLLKKFIALIFGFAVAGFASPASAATTTWADNPLVTSSAVTSTAGSPNINVQTGTWSVGDVVYFYGTSSSTNPFSSSATRYYVVSVSGDTIQVSTTPGGTAINAVNTTTASTMDQAQDWLTGANWTGGTAPNSNSTIANLGASMPNSSVPVVINGATTIYGLTFAGSNTGDLVLVSGANGTGLNALTFATNDSTTPVMTLSAASNAIISLGTTTAGSMALAIAGTQGLIFNSYQGGAITGVGLSGTSSAPLKQIRLANINWSAFSGGVQVQRGFIQLSAANELPTGQALTVGNATTTSNNLLAGFNLNSQNETIDALNGTSLGRIWGIGTLTVGSAGGTGNYGGVIGEDFTGATYATNLTMNGAGTETISGLIAGSGNVTVSAGMLILTTANSYTGGTTITSGTLQIGNANALGGSTGAVAVNGGTLDLHGNSLTIGNLSGTSTSGVITSSASGPLTLTANNTANSSFAGSIQNGSATVSLLEMGSGALTLSSSSSFSGGLTVTSGTVIQTAAGALGSGTITLGSGSGSAPATLVGNNGATVTNTNAIVVTAGGTGTYTIDDASGTSDLHFSGNIALNNALTLMAPSGGALFIDGTLNGSSNITVNDAGSTNKFVNLSASNASTFTGNVLVENSGDLKIGNINALGSSNTVTMDSTSKMDMGGFGLTIAGLNDLVTGAGGSSVIDNGSGLVLGGAGSYSFSGAISSSGPLTKSGAGTQVLSGSNSYGGNTTISGGVLQLGNGGTTGSLSTSSAITDNASLVFDRSNTVSQGTDFTASNITGSGSLTQAGSNNLTLSSSNSFSGGLTITSGTVIQTAAGALGRGTITLGSGSGSAPATLIGNNSATVTNTNAIVVTAGGTGTYTIDDAGADLHFSGNIALNNALTLMAPGSGGALFIDGTLNGSSNITVNDNGSTSKFVLLTANNASTFTGNVLVENSGYLKTDNANALGSSNVVTMDATSTLDLSGFSQTIAGLNDLVTGAGGSLVLDNGSGLTLAGSGNYSFSGAIMNGGSLTKSGAGAQVLSGSSSYTGSTTVSGGTLKLGNLYALSTGAVTVSGSGTLDLNGNSITNAFATGGLSGTLTNTGSAVNISATTISDNGNTFAVNGTGNITMGTIAGTSGLTLNMNGSNTLTLSGSADNTSLAVNVNSGTVVLSKSVAGNAANTLTLAGGTAQLAGAAITGNHSQINNLVVNSGTFDLNGQNAVDSTIGTLSGAGGVITNNSISSAAVLYVGAGGATVTGSTTFAGVIQDGSSNKVSVNFQGNGATSTRVITLSGNNTYSGTTTIGAGSLIVSGSLSGGGAVTVNSGGTIGGGGVIAGTTTVSGTLYPGMTATGTVDLTLKNTVAFDAGSTFKVNLDGVGDSDLLTINGTLSFSGADTLTANLINGATSLSGIYTIATATGGITGVSNLVADSTITGHGYEVVLANNNDSLELVAIPEPGTWAMMLAGTGMLIAFQRARRRKN